MISLFRKIRQKLLRENKVTRYLAYAIGEILLVVIGIYLAIEFNNFNEEKKDQRLNQNNISLLIEDLRKDSIYYNGRLIGIEGDQKTLESYEKRLQSPLANLDTLIQIARYEFRPGIWISGSSTNDTYNALVQSGEINLIDKDLRMKIFNHYSSQKKLEEVNNSHFYSYLDNIDQYNSKYGLQATSPYQDGPIEDAIWKNVELTDLATAFNPLFNSKRNHYTQTKRRVALMVDSTNELLFLLNEALDD